MANGFASCEDPAGLQAICDRLGPGTIGVFFERWMALLPLPLNAADRDHGYWWELSMRQIEVSRTLVFDAPRHGRAFFEALVADNLLQPCWEAERLRVSGHHLQADYRLGSSPGGGRDRLGDH